MTSLARLISDFESLPDIDDPAYVDRFEEVLEKIAVLSDPASIEALIPFLDDEHPYDGLMFSIIHVIEIFDLGRYVMGVLDSLPGFWEKSPKWATVIFIRILNSEPYQTELIRQLMTRSGKVKLAVTQAMGSINKRDDRFPEKTAPVLASIYASN